MDKEKKHNVVKLIGGGSVITGATLSRLDIKHVIMAVTFTFQYYNIIAKIKIITTSTVMMLEGLIC